VFTARYALSPYIKQIPFVFKGLIRLQATGLQRPAEGVWWNDAAADDDEDETWDRCRVRGETQEEKNRQISVGNSSGPI
jgi:hypothetical protein